MKKCGLLNGDILGAIAKLGHTQTLAIADAGLPIPSNVPCIDISLIAGIPSFQDVLKAVCNELVIESYTIAQEATVVQDWVNEALPNIQHNEIPHENFKKFLEHCTCIIRTGETTPYANIILTGGVNF